MNNVVKNVNTYLTENNMIENSLTQTIYNFRLYTQDMDKKSQVELIKELVGKDVDISSVNTKNMLSYIVQNSLKSLRSNDDKTDLEIVQKSRLETIQLSVNNEYIEEVQKEQEVKTTKKGKMTECREWFKNQDQISRTDFVNWMVQEMGIVRGTAHSYASTIISQVDSVVILESTKSERPKKTGKMTECREFFSENSDMSRSDFVNWMVSEKGIVRGTAHSYASTIIKQVKG